MFFDEVENCRGHPGKILVTWYISTVLFRPGVCYSILCLVFGGSMAYSLSLVCMVVRAVVVPSVWQVLVLG